MFLQPLLSSKQSGFRKRDSTEFQLTRLVQQWSNAMDKSQFVGVIFLDIKKAFDRVYLPGLLYKLESAGVRGRALQWFRNFLQNRCQRTMIGQSVSSVEYFHAGVPQDAILSPLLFSLYMNDITAFTNGDVNLFADDTSAFTVSDSVADLQCSLQTVADELSSWFSNWALTINVTKTAVMVLCGRRSVPQISIHINGNEIQQVNVHKHLGVHIDSHLSWSYHISAIIKQGIIQIGSAATTAAPFAAFGNSDTFPDMYSTCPRVRIRRLEWSWEKQLRTSGAPSTCSCSPDHRHPSLRTPPAATPASPGGFRQIGWPPLCQVWNHRIQVDLPKGKVARPSDGICWSMARLCSRAHVVDEFSFSIKLNCSSTPATSDWNS